MKKISIGISIILALMGCEEVVEVNIPSAPPRLVVDAQFNKFMRTENPRSEGVVKLSLSAPFFETATPPALGAKVSLSDPINNLIYDFEDPNNNGNYYANFVPEFDIPYTLEIIYENEVYQATTSMRPAAVIEEVVQGDGILFDDNDREIKITIKDDPEQQNFYYFDLDMGNYLTSDDEFYNGNSFPFSYFFDDLEIGDTLNIRVYGSDENFNTFFELLLSQSGEDGGGGPFATAPATVRGNVINLSNPDHYPFGYFQISEGFEKTIEITK